MEAFPSIPKSILRAMDGELDIGAQVVDRKPDTHARTDGVRFRIQVGKSAREPRAEPNIGARGKDHAPGGPGAGLMDIGIRVLTGNELKGLGVLAADGVKQGEALFLSQIAVKPEVAGDSVDALR